MRPVILVTGASGQIGRAMTRLLDAQGLAHRGIDLAPSVGNAPFLQCDLSSPDEGALKNFCRSVTHVISLAGRISRSKSLAESYGEQYRVSVQGTRNLLKALPAGLQHLCFASSMTVYGSPRAERVDETEPAQPNCIYALCKLAAERHLQDFSAKTGVPTALLRYSSVYGPGPALKTAIPHMINRLLKGQAPEINGEGLVARDYLFIDDLCGATLQASLKRAGGVYNVGTGIGTSTLKLARTLIQLTKSSMKPIHLRGIVDAQAAASLVYDISKMRRELGYSPRVSLEEGLKITIQHFEAVNRGGVL